MSIASVITVTIVGTRKMIKVMIGTLASIHHITPDRSQNKSDQQ